MITRHLPFMWKFRLLAAIDAGGRLENRRFLEAWARAEGGNAAYNPLNTTMPWPGATDYNSAHVRNYPSGDAGITATAKTLRLNHYTGIVRDLRLGVHTAEEMARRNARELDVWGTGGAHVLAALANVGRIL